MLHYPTCKVWATARKTSCDCPPRQPWRISMVGSRWEIARFLDGKWTRFMTADTHRQAADLVTSLRWLSRGGSRV